MPTIADRISRIRTRIAQAALAAGRPADDIRLLAVSKTKPVSSVEAAYACGQTAFGENYLQDALEKIQHLTALPLEWHFIGQIQSNKTRPIAENFQWVHSIDRVKIAQRLADQRPSELPPLQCCIQFDVNQETSKGGVQSWEEINALAAFINEQDSLTLRGLMAIPQHTDNYTQQRANFSRMTDLYNRLKAQYSHIDTLSMGMSGDLEAAIAEGSTMVRIGTDIFGARQ